MAKSLLDKLVEEVQATYWRNVHEAVRNRGGELVTEAVNCTFHAAVRSVVPTDDPKRLLQILRSIMATSFCHLPSELLLEFVGQNVSVDGYEALDMLTCDIIGQLAWMGDPLMALTLRDYYGPDFGREVLR